MGNYFLMNEPGFGRISWLLLFSWLILLGAGAYLYSMWQERNPVRQRFFRQLGLGLAVLSAVGILLLAFKAFGVPVASWRLWTYLVGLATLFFAGWSAWFYTSRLPQLLGATNRVGAGARRQPAQQGRGARTYGKSGGGARTYGTNGSRPATTAQTPPPPRPVATTGRREARRDKKRKSR